MIFNTCPGYGVCDRIPKTETIETKEETMTPEEETKLNLDSLSREDLLDLAIRFRNKARSTRQELEVQADLKVLHADLRALIDAQRRVAELEEEVKELKTDAQCLYGMGVDAVFNTEGEFKLLTMVLEQEPVVTEVEPADLKKRLELLREELDESEIAEAERVAKFWVERVQALKDD